MIPLIQGTYVENLKVLSSDQLLLAVAIGRITPGPANIYVASIGYMLYGYLGAGLALLAVTVPSFSAIPLVSIYEKLKTKVIIGRFFKGLTVTAIGLIFYSVYLLAKESLTSIDALLIFIFAIILIKPFRLNPLLGLFTASIFGLILFWMKG